VIVLLVLCLLQPAPSLRRNPEFDACLANGGEFELDSGRVACGQFFSNNLTIDEQRPWTLRRRLSVFPTHREETLPPEIHIQYSIAPGFLAT